MVNPDDTASGSRRKRRPIPPLETFASDTRPRIRLCDHPGCTAEGLYRAPKDRDLKEYFWFCLNHVQAYNKAWNYYQGLREEDIEAAIRHSICWDRPTWPLGKRGGPGHAAPDGLHDPFTVFDDTGPTGPSSRQERRSARYREDGPRARAMRVLDLSEPLTLDTLKTRYKTLVKRYHPDANGGDRESEERFKMVNEAYHVLMAALGA
ncbi:J domain-containing protein [Pararhodospirillum photometricum]|nr:J domain-containing protein [Pararhodospirillum photometricum]